MAVKKVATPEEEKRLLLARLKMFDVAERLRVPGKEIMHIRRAMKNHNKRHKEAPIEEELIEKLKQLEEHIHDARSIGIRL